jgi:hypothetical protein
VRQKLAPSEEATAAAATHREQVDDDFGALRRLAPDDRSKEKVVQHSAGTYAEQAESEMVGRLK